MDNLEKDVNYPHHLTKEKDKIRQYEAEGYTASYRLDGDELEDLEKNKKYQASELSIVKEDRFEGMSNPSDLSILYVIESKDGSKGTLLCPYGPTGNTAMAEFMSNVERKK